MTVRTFLRARLARSAAVAGALLSLALTGSTAAASTTPSPSPSPTPAPVPWGTVLVSGSAWAGAAAVLGDLNVYANGDGNQDRSGTYGLDYECVELAQRWAALRFGEQPVWPVAAAYQMWAAAPNLRVPFMQIPNGGGSAPEFGDLVVFNRTSTNPYGHVAVVSGTEPGYVDVVEQNWNDVSPTGTARLPIRGTTMPDRSGLPVVGWLRGPQPGYWLAEAAGHIAAFGGARWQGDLGHTVLARPVVGIARTPSGFGQWTVAADGGVFSFGDAGFHGSTGGMRLNKPVVGISGTADGQGYWTVASDGGVFAFGDAVFHGSTGGMRLNRPVVGMATTPSGRGYWLVASDGGVFSFGDAGFHGSTGGMRLNEPIVGMAATRDGMGYWLVAGDGGVFAFGDAAYHGSTGGLRLVAPVTGLAATSDGGGYWMAAADGGVFGFGDAPFKGSEKAAAPVVGIAATP